MAIKEEKIFKEIYDAYVYAYPAVIEELTRKTSLNPSKYGKEVHKLNTFYHTTELADASFRHVVAPNIDTVYSQAWLDLSEGAIIFEKPDLDRYVSIAFLDAYTNCENIIGTGGDGNEAGKYIITGPDFHGIIPEEYTHIPLPTNRNWVIVRTIIYGKNDTEAVKKIQNQLKLKPYGNAKQEAIYTSYHKELDYKPIQKITNLTLDEFFGIFNELLNGNPDKYAPTDKLEQWKSYGIGAGQTFTQDKDIQEITKDIPVTFLNNSQKGLKEEKSVDNWSYPDSAIGLYKTNYSLRANVALNGLGANPVSMCVYPATYVDSQGNPLDGTKRYKLHFEKGQLPPVNEYGFWSITLYDSKERYLVENEIHRYGINDRDTLKKNEDGSIDIFIQKDKPGDSVLTNWLPSDAQPFNLVLRIYLAGDKVFSGEWKPPVISEI